MSAKTSRAFDNDGVERTPYGVRVRDKFRQRAGLDKASSGFALRDDASFLQGLYERTLLRAHLAEADAEIIAEDYTELNKQLDTQKAIAENLARMVAWFQEKTGIEHSGAAGALVVTCKRCGRQVDGNIILGHLMDHVENREPRMS